jgi:Zn-dependent peptidase ImmA (M78 family)
MLKKGLDIQTKRKCALLTLRWCQENLGINKRKKNKLKLVVRIYFPKDEQERTCHGSYYFEDNKIIVYEINCETIELMVATIIHEYTHHLQSGRKYWEFFKTHHYSSHPYERQAKRYEEKYAETCLFEIWDSLY